MGECCSTPRLIGRLNFSNPIPPNRLSNTAGAVKEPVSRKALKVYLVACAGASVSSRVVELTCLKEYESRLCRFGSPGRLSVSPTRTTGRQSIATLRSHWLTFFGGQLLPRELDLSIFRCFCGCGLWAVGAAGLYVAVLWLASPLLFSLSPNFHVASLAGGNTGNKTNSVLRHTPTKTPPN